MYSWNPAVGRTAMKVQAAAYSVHIYSNTCSDERGVQSFVSSSDVQTFFKAGDAMLLGQPLDGQQSFKGFDTALLDLII